MWQPDPAWRPFAAGRGASGGGLWLARADGRDWVVKRVDAPGPDDPADVTRPDHPFYWRRELEVALAGTRTAGLVMPEVRRAEEDESGYVVWSARVEPEPVPAELAARALGRLSGGALHDRPWLSRRLLTERVRRTADRGGWSTLARTLIAPLTTELWCRREELLARYDALPQRPAHGDAVPANLLRPDGPDVVAADWGSLGWAPAGADLGYYALSRPEELGVLRAAFSDGMADSAGSTAAVPDPADVEFAARLMAALTVTTRADWALSRADHGPGELAGKLRHPAVAPYLRALQRQLPAIEELLSST